MRSFDGILCFGGEDWWYHNRGHYDMQMMRELSAAVPVLYINSIGMRVHRPTEGAMYLRRVARKLRSVRRGLVQVRDGFAVLSPLAAAGSVGRAVSAHALPVQVRRAMRELGISRPLLWVACPPAARFLGEFDAAGLVYQRTDRFEAFGGVDRERVEGYDRALKNRADVTLFCSRELYEAEHASCGRAAFIDHGVDYDRFAAAGCDPASHPEDVRSLPRPRVGFIGGVDAHTFDPRLFLEVAQRLADVEFVVVGACSLPAGWCTLPNVHLLGQRPYDRVAGYMAACDVLIMPWNSSEWIRACNPVKLKEYLAVGRPVVSTPFRELEHYDGFVRIASDAASFAVESREALATLHDPQPGRLRVSEHTWGRKAGRVVEELGEVGLRPSAAGVMQRGGKR